MSSGGQVVNAMTVDVEDYFQVSAFDAVVPRASWDQLESRVVPNTRRLLELFETSRVRSTFFFLGWIAERFPSLVREVAGAGHEIASHGYGHQLIYALTPAEFRADVRRARHVIEQAAGVAVVGYRAPSFSVIRSTLWALDILAEEGYEYDASIFPIHHDRYGIPDAERHVHLAAGRLVEFPASTTRLAGMNLPIGGGGYFRLLPYAWTRWGIRRVNEREGRPVVFYLHPWEVDSGQPRLDVGRLTRIRHYAGLDRTVARLTRLMGEFRFDTVRAVLRFPVLQPSIGVLPAASAGRG